jgi:CBS domain-containing protein
MQVKDVMTSPAITIRDDAPLHEVAAMLAENRVSGLPVVDATGALVGVVSEADILLKETGEPSAARTAGQAMTAPPLTIEPELPIGQAARVMIGMQVNRLPVVSGGNLVGIVTRGDLVRAFVRSDAEIAAEIRESPALRWHGIDPNGLVLVIRDGAVEVAGPLPVDGDAELLEQLIRQIPGVVAARYLSRVGPPGIRQSPGDKTPLRSS